VLVEDSGDYGNAMKFIGKLTPEEAVEHLEKYGGVLLERDEPRATELIAAVANTGFKIDFENFKLTPTPHSHSRDQPQTPLTDPLPPPLSRTNHLLRLHPAAPGSEGRRPTKCHP